MEKEGKKHMDTREFSRQQKVKMMENKVGQLY